MTQAEIEVEVYRAAVRIYAARLVALATVTRDAGKRPDLGNCIQDAKALLEKTEAILAPPPAAQSGGKK
jgi:hypothetical protein